MKQFKSDQGYISFALGEVYLRAAYAQCLSIKKTQKINNYAVIVDSVTNAAMSDEYRQTFDHVVVLNYIPTSDWDMSQLSKVFPATPWKETVLLDADMLFCKSVDHWWPAMRQRDVCFTTTVHDYKGHKITSRAHRQLFDINLLPNVYGAFVYFRYSQFSTDFFGIVKHIIGNWEWFAKEHLIKNDDMRPRVDEIFALAARIVGSENVTLPVPLPTFVHGKEQLWKLSSQTPWYEQLYTTWNGTIPVIGHVQQDLPFHYHHKEWLTNDIIERIRSS